MRGRSGHHGARLACESVHPLRAMGDLQARLARTHPAALLLIVDDEMVTVPLWTKTPPPCKHKCKTCEKSIGAMGKIQISAARTRCS
jgi:hypothetical protein